MDVARITPQAVPTAATPRAVLEQNSSLQKAASQGEAAALVRKQPIVTSLKKMNTTERTADKRRRRKSPLDNSRSAEDLGFSLDTLG